MKKKILIVISNVGYGHYSRQKAIINELLKKKKFQITVATRNSLKLFKNIYGSRLNYYNFDSKFNLIKKDGCLDINSSKNLFKSSLKKINTISQKLRKFKNYDLVISDYCLAGIYFSKVNNIKSIGICHFTWSWFFSEIKLDRRTLKVINYFEKICDLQVFPPFTPKACLLGFKKKIMINFITDHKINLDYKNLKKNILILDSGGRVLKKKINNVLKYLLKSNFKFFIDKRSVYKKNLNLVKKSNNLSLADGFKSMSKYFKNSRLIIGRAGFNTITEALRNKKPIMLIDEKNNPEIKYNIKKIKNLNVGYLFKNENWNSNLTRELHKYFNKKYMFNIQKIKKVNFKFNGAKEFAKIVENELTQAK